MRYAAKLLTLMMVAPVVASAQVLTFEGINTAYPSGNSTQVLDFYNGGTSSAGTFGSNLGISFTSNALAICLNSTSVFCSNTSRGGLGDPASQRGGLFWLDGTETFMNVASGFSGGFSFFYTSISFSGSVLIYDGLNGSGNQIGSIDLTPTPSDCPDYGAQFCPFYPAGTTFLGFAKSVSWGGVANQIVFDDITLGSSTPGNPSDVVPEPATMTLLATGLAGMAAARKKRKA